jgi:hypothetical protein
MIVIHSIYDSGGDGICCDYGGSYSLKTPSGDNRGGFTGSKQRNSVIIHLQQMNSEVKVPFIYPNPLIYYKLLLKIN